MENPSLAAPPDPWLLGVPDAAACPPRWTDLAGAESPEACPPMAARRVTEALRAPTGDVRAARATLAEAVSRRHSVNRACVTLAAGTRALLPAILAMACDGAEGQPRRALLGAPSPPLHRLAAWLAHLRHEDARVEDGGDGEGLAPSLLSLLAENPPRVVAVAHPANPTGQCLSREALLALVSAAHHVGVLLVVDEAYADAARDDVLRAAALLPDFPGLVVTRTFSSLEGLAALPCAYALSSPEVAARLASCLRGREPGLLATLAATAVVDEPSFAQAVADRVRRNRFRMARRLADLGYEVRAHEAPWVMARGPGDVDAVRGLAARGVRVRDLEPWGFAGWFRARAGSDDETDRLLQAAEGLAGTKCPSTTGGKRPTRAGVEDPPAGRRKAVSDSTERGTST